MEKAQIVELIGQVVGVIAMFFNIFSFQQKKARDVIAYQFGGATLFCINYFLLGLYGGGLLNIIAALRNILFYNKKIFKTDHPAWIPVFEVMFIASYICSFAIFKTPATPFHFVVECLPVIGMTVATISFRSREARVIRRLGLISSSMWLIYNIIGLSIGAICCEVFSLISIIVGMIRFDIGKKATEESEA